jgi:outer membrane receptor protein involved in Fe transport
MIGYDVVPTNALPTTPPSFYTTLDANLKLDIIDNLWFAFKVTNIIGTNYTHPGIQTADCATTTCTGSYNAQLAQPGRGFYGTLGYRFDQEKALHPK